MATDGEPQLPVEFNSVLDLVHEAEEIRLGLLDNNTVPHSENLRRKVNNMRAWVRFGPDILTIPERFANIREIFEADGAKIGDDPDLLHQSWVHVGRDRGILPQAGSRVRVAGK